MLETGPFHGPDWAFALPGYVEVLLDHACLLGLPKIGFRTPRHRSQQLPKVEANPLPLFFAARRTTPTPLFLDLLHTQSDLDLHHVL